MLVGSPASQRQRSRAGSVDSTWRGTSRRLNERILRRSPCTSVGAAGANRQQVRGADVRATIQSDDPSRDRVVDSLHFGAVRLADPIVEYEARPLGGAGGTRLVRVTVRAPSWIGVAYGDAPTLYRYLFVVQMCSPGRGIVARQDTLASVSRYCPRETTDDRNGNARAREEVDS